jgi:CheY-like chemotaxis protein
MAKVSPSQTSRLRVLWIEDGAGDRYLIRAALEQLGTTARVRFIDRRGALRLAVQPSPDLVVLDLDTLGMDVTATLQSLRGSVLADHSSVAVFGSFARHRPRAVVGAGVAFVHKPVDFAAFVAAVGQVLATAIGTGARSPGRPQMAA